MSSCESEIREGITFKYSMIFDNYISLSKNDQKKQNEYLIDFAIRERASCLKITFAFVCLFWTKRIQLRFSRGVALISTVVLLENPV